MALIDPLTAFAAIKTGISLVERGIKAGKELHELASPIMKWASNEAHFETHSSSKGDNIFSVVGGGDTVAVINSLNMINNFNFVSTAGGAFLEYLEGKILPGIKALN